MRCFKRGNKKQYLVSQKEDVKKQAEKQPEKS
jgi:hypothetical protein